MKGCIVKGRPLGIMAAAIVLTFFLIKCEWISTMEYLAIIFIIIIITGLLANRELARDKKRIKRMIREYSFRTYSPEDAEENHPEKEAEEKKV